MMPAASFVDTHAPVRAVLKLADFRRLLVAYTLNELAWSIGSLALAVLVYRRTGSAIGAAAYFLCSQFVPALIAPALVARVDQLAPGRVLPALYGAEAVLFGALAWVAPRFALAPVLALTVADGIFAITARPIARAATVAITTPHGLLREGNAIANASFSIAFMAGPALGGAVVVTGGTVAALLANSGVFVVMAITLLTAHGLRAGRAGGSPSAGRLKAALAHARRQPSVRLLLWLQVTAILFFSISVPVEVVFAQHTLHAGAAGYGALLSAWGAGAVLGSAVYARWRRLPGRTMIVLGALALGAGFVVMAISPSLGVAIVGAVIAGVGNGIEAVAVRTTLQEHVEDAWMAMILSLSESILQAAPGGGILIGGAVTALAGSRVALAVAGAGALAIGVAARAILSAEGGAATVAHASDGASADSTPRRAQAARR
jgi:predicted MFS family arabinose efflux permease